MIKGLAKSFSKALDEEKTQKKFSVFHLLSAPYALSESYLMR